MNDLQRHDGCVEALQQAVLGSPGVTSTATRAAAADGALPDEPLGTYAAKVRESSYRVTDADIDALKAAGRSEDEILEVTVAAALGAALQRYERGMRILREGG